MSLRGAESDATPRCRDDEALDAHTVPSNDVEQAHYLLPPSTEHRRARDDTVLAATVCLERSTPSPSISQPTVRQSSETPDAQPDEIGTKGLSKQPTTANFLSQWWKELFAIFASVAFLIAVYAVLLNIHNTRLTNWSMPFDMQPTALIAVLTTLSRVFLLAAVAEAIGQLKWMYFQQRPQRLDAIETFDSASRGALGSIAFLGKSPWKALLASLGAMITILVLAMEPFAQQALSFQNAPVPHPQHHALLPRARSYDLGTYRVDSPASDSEFAINENGWAPMIEAILTGLYNPRDQVQPVCPSGNCTWDPFDTLAVCASCEDLTSTVTRSCRGNNTLLDYYCTYEMPDGAKLRLSCTGGTYYARASLMESKTKTRSPPDGPEIARVSSILLDYPGDGQPPSSCSSDWLDTKYTATQCTFKWCLNRFRSNVTNGILSEDLLSSTELFFPKNCYCPIWNVTCYFTFLAFTHLGVYEPNGATYVLAGFQNEQDAPTDPCARNWWGDPSAFWINVMDDSSIADNLDAIFTQSSFSWNQSILSKVLYTVNKGNLTSDALGVATSLTNMIREGPNTTSHAGRVLTTEVIIRVNWLWLIYPSAIVLLTLIFFVATIIFSAQGNLAIWKSSSLAMLFHGLSGWNNDTPLRTTSEMKQAARKRWVQLEEDETGSLRLVGG